MEQIKWEWAFFLIGLFTLVIIQFLEEYKEHKKIDFAQFKKYPKPFWIMNSLYVIFGAIFTTMIGSIMNPNNPLAAIIYAGSWEGILGNLISRDNHGVKK